MILITQKDFEDAVLHGEEIKHETMFYTGDDKPNVCIIAASKPEIGYFDKEKNMIYCGDLRGQEVWCVLQDAPKQMNNKDAKEWCEKQGGMLPTINMLTVAYLNKEIINKSLKDNNGEPFKENDYYWSSSEYSSNYSWVLSMNDGYRGTTSKYNYYVYVRCFQLL